MADEIKRAAIWKRVAAAILDFLTLFSIGDSRSPLSPEG